MRKIKVGKRRRVFERPQEMKLLRLADRRFRAFAIALRESIARPQEIRVVRWEDLRKAGGLEWKPFDLVSGNCMFMLEGAKGFDRRTDDDSIRIIPVSPRLGRLIWRLWLKGADPSMPIFLNRNRRPWTNNAVRCQMRKLRVLAGFVADRRGEMFVAYSFRHTAATRFVRTGIRDKKLADLMGHSTTRMIGRYVHLNAADLVDAARTVWEAKTRRPPKKEPPGSLRNHPDCQG